MTKKQRRSRFPHKEAANAAWLRLNWKWLCLAASECNRFIPISAHPTLARFETISRGNCLSKLLRPGNNFCSNWPPNKLWKNLTFRVRKKQGNPSFQNNQSIFIYFVVSGWKILSILTSKLTIRQEFSIQLLTFFTSCVGKIYRCFVILRFICRWTLTCRFLVKRKKEM